MQPEAVEPAFAAIAQAMALRASAERGEQAQIEALAARYSPDPAADRKALDAAYADAMGKVAASLPRRRPGAGPVRRCADEPAALGLLGGGRRRPRAAPPSRWRRWSGCWGGTRTIRAPSISTSTPSRPRPRPSGRSRSPTGSNGQMPGAGHLVHMPAHIYYRVGRYLICSRSTSPPSRPTRRCLAASPQDPVYQYNYYPHNVHFVLVSARMAGDGPLTVAAAEKLAGLMPADMAKAIPPVQAIQQAPYFAHAQFSPAAT